MSDIVGLVLGEVGQPEFIYRRLSLYTLNITGMYHWEI